VTERVEPRTHLGHSLASEWIKLRSVRSTPWCTALVLFFVVAFGTLGAVFVQDGVHVGDDILSLGMGGFLIAQVPVITMGVLCVSSEYGTGMVRTTLTVSPRRTRMLTAKALVLGGLVLAAGLAALGAFAVVVTGMLGGDAGPQDSGVLVKTVLGGALYLCVLAEISLAVGALVRHSAGAISIMLALSLLPSVMGLFVGGRLGYYLITYAPVSVSAALIGEGIDPDVSGWHLLLVLTVLTAALLAAAGVVSARRDV
jgi:ABC-type transport system involved in multi-copper enzyme maturation permease subunit